MVQKKNGVRLSLELHSDGAMDTSYHLGKSNWIFGKALSLSRWKPREQVVQRCCGVSALGDSENPTGRVALKNLLSPDVLRVGGKTVRPLEDPSNLCASAIP